ncbi:MAG TPA: FlgD immunoglobulin-like domain containing protein [Polyangiales bacterium]|nr:FlgD immunoglobulin-like domain containing protein [Polyangiales bacterium]
MAIDPVQTSKPIVSPAPANPKGNMGKETFLKLLVAELKNQDPLDPSDSKQMVAQLAQLTSVEKLSGIDERLQTLQNLTASASGIGNAGLIGRKVVADAHTLAINGTDAAPGRFTLNGDADKVMVKVRDANGQLVQTLDLGKQKLGPVKFTWSGDTAKGGLAPVGNYTFEVAAQAANGNTVVTSTRTTGLVTEVSYEGSQPEVIVGGERIALGDVISIAQ